MKSCNITYKFEKKNDSLNNLQLVITKIKLFVLLKSRNYSKIYLHGHYEFVLYVDVFWKKEISKWTFVLECQIGFTSHDLQGKQCKKCPANLFGYRCNTTCYCKENERYI